MIDGFYMKKELKQRGWTDRLIKQYLGNPDQTKVNMHYQSGPPICLYDADRVHVAESQQDFIKECELVTQRRQAAQAGNATKRDKMRKQLDAVQITVPELDSDRLTHLAVEHYNSSVFGTGRPSAKLDSDEDFLDRIRVNYLRHVLTNYHAILQATAGKVGAEDAYIEIKERILDAIAEVYPELSAECIQQSQRLYDESSLE